MQDEFEIRSEIALRILRETLIDLRRIARWTGLTQEQVHVLSQQVAVSYTHLTLPTILLV